MQPLLAERLRVIRAQQGLTVMQAAEKIGIDRHTLRDLELGRRRPNFETMEKVAKGYGISVGDLVEEGEPFPLAAAPSGTTSPEATTGAGRQTPTAAELEEVTAELERLIAQRRAAIEQWQEAGIDALEKATCGAYEMDRANEQIYHDLQELPANEIIERSRTEDVDDRLLGAARDRVNAYSRLLGVAAEALNVAIDLREKTSHEITRDLERLKELKDTSARRGAS